jgi:hypothetical protein
MKASIAITLLQWAKKKIHIYILWAAIALDAAICMAIVLFFLLQCAPISYTWEFINPAVKGHCAPETTQILMGFALCAVTVSVRSGKDSYSCSSVLMIFSFGCGTVFPLPRHSLSNNC